MNVIMLESAWAQIVSKVKSLLATHCILPLGEVMDYVQTLKIHNQELWAAFNSIVRNKAFEVPSSDDFIVNLSLVHEFKKVLCGTLSDQELTRVPVFH